MMVTRLSLFNLLKNTQYKNRAPSIDGHFRYFDSWFNCPSSGKTRLRGPNTNKHCYGWHHPSRRPQVFRPLQTTTQKLTHLLSLTWSIHFYSFLPKNINWLCERAAESTNPTFKSLTIFPPERKMRIYFKIQRYCQIKANRVGSTFNI